LLRPIYSLKMELKPTTNVPVWDALLDDADDALIVYDASLRIVALNARAVRISGRDRAELIGRDRRSIFGDDDVQRRLEAMLAAGETSLTALVAGMQAGASLSYEARFRVHDAPDGRFVLEISRKISHARLLREREIARRELLTGEAFVTTDPELAAPAVLRFDDRRRIVGWSPEAEALFGWTAAEMLGRNVMDFDFVHPEDRPLVNRRMHELVTNALEANISENRNLRKDGVMVSCFWTNSRVVAEDGTIQVLSFVQDLTLARRLRKQQALGVERLRSLVENSPDGILSLDSAGRILAVNPALLASGGYRADQLVDRPVDVLFERPDVAAFRAALRRPAGAAPFACRPRRSDGTSLEVEATSSPIVSDGEIVGAYVTLRDVSARNRDAARLARQHERVRELYLCAAGSTLSSEAQIQATLELGCKLLGMEFGTIYDAAEDGGAIAFSVDTRERSGPEGPYVLPQRICRLSIATVGALALDELGAIPVFGEPLPGELKLEQYLGTPIDVAGVRYGSLNFASTQPRAESLEATDRDLAQLMSVLVGSAIERRRSRAHLRSLAYYDALTGLPNRVMLAERLDDALMASFESRTECAVLFLDLDRFKDINDTLGHALGDRLLQLAAERILGCVRSSDTVARMGGDEFIVLMPKVPGVADVTVLAERLLASLDDPFFIGGFEQYVTTSVGVAIYPGDGRDAETLIKHADIAMYRAKDRGRNTYHLYTPELNAGVTVRLSQEKGLRKALERGEFTAFYQPIIDLAGRRIHGVEALARWRHPTLGLLRPDAFIASAETSGLIVTLGAFILEDACRQVKCWHDGGFPDLRLSVNLSARQFRETQLMAQIYAALERTGFSPHLLDFEITESVAMGDAQASIEILRELKSAGVRISVDDFGTGYSSLGYLRRFPIDAIKIDRSFVKDVTSEPDDAVIVRTVIGMAHSLGLSVVAEGVETHEQLAFVEREGCDRVQGFYYCPPLPAPEFERYMHAWNSLPRVG